MTDLTPPDRERCQALVPNKTWSPLAFGPSNLGPKGEKQGGSRQQDRYYRCPEKPVCICTETKSDDGMLGSMSLCGNCFVELCLQRAGTFEITEKLS